MPDLFAGTYAALNGVEVVNSQRTIAYVQNLGVPVTVSEGCWCQNIQELAGCDTPPTGYSTPTTDSAPWFDASVPESADFAGFLPVEFDGLSSTYTRSTTDLLTGGSVLGRLRPRARVLTWRGFLFGRTCCATQYGLRWLTSTLSGAGECDVCDGVDLDILYCCPEVSGIVDMSCPDDLPPVATIANDDAFRTFHRVGLSEGPTVLSTRRIGCGTNCVGSCVMEIEFSIIAGNPFMHRQPITVCDMVQFPDCSACAEIIKVVDPSECPVIPETCGPTPEPCLTDPNCPDPVLPSIPAFVDPCACDPLDPVELCCSINNDLFGQFFESVPVIEIFSGSQAMRNLEIRFFENPQERDCNEINDACFLCDTLKIRFIPPNTTLTIDGTTKRITAICPGGDIQAAEKLSQSPFNWPILRCISYCICIIADCVENLSDDHYINIIVVPREM